MAAEVRISRRSALTAVAGVLATGRRAMGADFPTRPLSMVVPYAPGGLSDQMARVVALGLSKRVGQPVVVLNKPGAGTMVGIAHLRQQEPDGYTLLYAGNSLPLLPYTNKSFRYDLTRDFAPLSMVMSGMFVLVARPGLPVDNLAQLIAHAKANPGKLNFGSQGNGSVAQLTAELFKSAAGLDMVHVPYQGSGPAMLALARNEIDIYFEPPTTVKPLLADKRIKALAVTGGRRSSVLPEIPTGAEAGLPALVSTFWGGFLAHGDTPKDRVSFLSNSLGEVMRSADVRSRILEMGIEPEGTGSAEFAKVIASDRQTWGHVIQKLGIQPE